MENIKKRIAEKIRASRRIAISSHIRPDADSIGSGLALSLMLRQLGKEAVFCNTDRAPDPITRLPHYESIQLRQIYPEAFDTLILIEGATAERTGQGHIDHYFSINIDHHAASPREANLNWVIPEASAVGEMIYDLGIELGIEFDRDIAFNLYAAIVSDTGSFKYSNTTFRALRTASELVKKGKFVPVDVINLLFNSNSPEKIRMLTQVLSTLTLAFGNRVAMIDFKRSFLQTLQLKDIETEDIITIARSINGVQVLLFFKEIEGDYYRVSIRSRDDFSALRIAQTFQGGGHNHAAGFFYRGNLETAQKEILELVRQQLT